MLSLDSQLSATAKQGQCKCGGGGAYSHGSIHQQGCELSVDDHEIRNEDGGAGPHQETDYEDNAFANSRVSELKVQIFI